MSDVPNDPMLDLVEEYALGMLEGTERSRFESELERNPQLQRELAATLETLETLAFSTPVTPSPELKSRVMAQLAAPASTSKVLPFVTPARRSYKAVWLSAALAASLLITAKFWYDLRALHDAADATAATALAQSRTIAQRDSLIAQLIDPSAETVTLAATGAAKPLIRAFVNHARHTVMISAALLEQLPTGREYQLWFIVDGKPVPSITFTADSAGRALVNNVPLPAGAVAAAAITLEPAGGSPAPTSPVIFVGKLATE